MERIGGLPAPLLDVRDLRLMLALAAAGSTARAASLLHLTQPAISRALLAAEEKLGTRLFERTPRGLLATDAGQRLITGAGPLLAEWTDLEHRVRAPSPSTSRVRLVCECYTAYHWLPSVITSLRQTIPDLEITLGIEHTDAPVAALEAGKVDVALLTTGISSDDAVAQRPLLRDEVVFVVSASHPLAGRKVLTRGDLRNNPLLSANVSPGEAEWFLTRVFGRGRPALKFERFPLTEAIVDVARAGLGVAIMSDWIASAHVGKGDLVAKRLAGGPLMRPWRFAWRRETGEAASRLYSALLATAPRARLPG